jgi:FMN phosphatase YigB (HAD superfamily)
MIEKLAVKPPQIVFVDDFIENIESARAAGIQVIHFRSPEQARQQLQKILAQR